MPTFTEFAQGVLNIGCGAFLLAVACWLIAGLISLALSAWEK
jgi:hypothetical protein